MCSVYIYFFHSSDTKTKTNENEETDEDNDDFFDFDKIESESNTVQDVKEELLCPPRGTLDLGPCKFGAPLFASWPHFYGANEVNFESVRILKINIFNFGIFSDVERGC